MDLSINQLLQLAQRGNSTPVQLPQPAAVAFNGFVQDPAPPQQGGGNQDKREAAKLQNSLNQSKADNRKLNGQLRVCKAKGLGKDMRGSGNPPTKAKGLVGKVTEYCQDSLASFWGKKTVLRSDAQGLGEKTGGPHEPSTLPKNSATFPPLPQGVTNMVAAGDFKEPASSSHLPLACESPPPALFSASKPDQRQSQTIRTSSSPRGQVVSIGSVDQSCLLQSMPKSGIELPQAVGTSSISLQQQLQLEIDEAQNQLAFLEELKGDTSAAPFNVAFLLLSIQESRDRVRQLEQELAQSQRYVPLPAVTVDPPHWKSNKSLSQRACCLRFPWVRILLEPSQLILVQSPLQPF